MTGTEEAAVGYKLAAPVDNMKNNMPDVMAELTKQFIEKPDANGRAKIRKKMKAILDFLSADTSYPELPKEERSAFGIEMLRPQPQFGMADAADYTTRAEVAPIPGADRENESILGG